MINFNRIFKNFGLLETLVISSLLYVIAMLLWTASTRSKVEDRANLIKSNHKQVVDFINDQVNACDQNKNASTVWGDSCEESWSSEKIVRYIINNSNLNNPYSIKKDLIQSSEDPRIQAEGKAGQSTDKGIIFVSSNDFNSEPGSEWIIGTCVKSPCVAAGNNELVSVYR